MPVTEFMAAAGITAVQQIVAKLVVPTLTRLFKSVKQGTALNIEQISTHFGDYLKRTYEKNSVLNTLVFHNQQKQLRDLYIPLTLVQEGIDKTHERNTIRIDGYPAEFISQFRRVLISDTAGMGKSTLTKIMFLSAIDQEAGIPFYVELRKLNKNHLLLDEIRDQLDSLTKEFDDSLMRSFFQMGGFIFFLDGFDEISLSDRKEVTEDIKRFVEKAPDNYFILTSRFEQALVGFGDFQAMKIQPLKQEEAYALLRKYDSEGDISGRLIEKLESGDYLKIKEFLQNPLLVSLLFIGFEYKPEIPLKIHLFYDQVFEAYYNNHDLSKDGYYTREKQSGLDMADFARVLRAIGYICLTRNRLEFNRNDFLEVLTKAGKLSCLSIQSSEDLMQDLLHAVPLFCQDGVNYKWVHKSMQEYFAADFINRDCADKKVQILKSLASNPDISNYFNMLELYADLDCKCFQQVFVVPLLDDFISYIEAPINVDGLDMKKPVMLRRQIIFSRDTFVYLFTKEDEKKPAPDLFNYLRSLVGPGPARFTLSHANTGSLRGVIIRPNEKDGLVRLLSKKYPEFTVRTMAKVPTEFKHIVSGELYHCTEGNMQDNPEAYDELNKLALLSSDVYLDYGKVKLERERIQKIFLDNEEVFKDLLVF